MNVYVYVRMYVCTYVLVYWCTDVLVNVYGVCTHVRTYVPGVSRPANINTDTVSRTVNVVNLLCRSLR